MSLRYGSLFSGYGGLDLGLQSVLGGFTAWFVEFDKHPSAILAHHWPDVPNYGDVTKVDWTQVEPVDVLTGGSPCQDLSHAGKRAGMTDGTRSNLWVQMREAIAILRPRLVVWENVRGALSAPADSGLESCPRCVGDPRDRGPVLRALGRVVGDLSELGYVGWWHGLRAADVGAAHGRFRVFLFAVPAADARGFTDRINARVAPGPQARTHEGDGAESRGRVRAGTEADLTLLPTPAVNDMGEGKTVEHWDAWTGRMKAAHGNGNGRGKSLAIEAQRLLPTPVSDNSRGLPSASTDYASLANVAATLLPTPKARDHKDHRIEVAKHRPDDVDSLNRAIAHLLPTPRATDGTKGGPNQRGSSGDLMLPSAVQLLPTPSVADVEGGRKHRSGARSDELLLNGIAHHQAWGDYAPAIARWETAIGRPAPAPTEPGPKGNPRLSAHFVEWLMGLPEGHVTGVDIPRSAQLKSLGNGVVPQQAAAAARWWLSQIKENAA